MNTFFQPFLGILVNCMISVPATGGISAGIPVFADGGAAHLDPGLEGLDVGIEPAYNLRDVVAPPLFQLLAFAVFPVGVLVGKAVGLFGVADVVEMDAVYVITRSYFFYDA